MCFSSTVILFALSTFSFAFSFYSGFELLNNRINITVEIIDIIKKMANRGARI